MIVWAVAVLIAGTSARADNTHALDLEATDSQRVWRADTASLSVTGDLTIELWARFESLPATNDLMVLVSKYTSLGPDRSYRLALYNDAGTPKLRLIISNNGSSQDVHAFAWTPTVGTWYHIAMVFTASAARAEFFLNGASQGTSTLTMTSIYNGASKLTLGAYENSNGYYVGFMDGQLDEVRVWAEARSGGDIADDYLKELTGAEPNLRAYWKLNNDLNDATSNGNTLAGQSQHEVLRDDFSRANSNVIGNGWSETGESTASTQQILSNQVRQGTCDCSPSFYRSDITNASLTYPIEIRFEYVRYGDRPFVVGLRTTSYWNHDGANGLNLQIHSPFNRILNNMVEIARNNLTTSTSTRYYYWIEISQSGGNHTVTVRRSTSSDKPASAILGPVTYSFSVGDYLVFYGDALQNFSSQDIDTVVVLDSSNGPAFSTDAPLLNAAPAAFSLLGPAHLSNTTDATPRFTWQAAVDPESDPVTYTLKLSADAGFTEPVYRTIAGLVSPAYAPVAGEEIANGTYHWRVTASDGLLSRSSNETWQVTINASTPSAPTLTGMTSDFATGQVVRLTGRVPTGEGGAGLTVYGWDGAQYVALAGSVEWAGDSFAFTPETGLPTGSRFYAELDDGVNPPTVSENRLIEFGSYANVFQDAGVSHSGTGQSMRLEESTSYAFKMAVNAGDPVTVTAWLRKNGSYSGAAPKITLTGLGITGTGAATDSVTVGANTWETLSVTGTPNAAGVLTLTVETFSTAAGAAVWIDDVGVAQ